MKGAAAWDSLKPSRPFPTRPGGKFSRMLKSGPMSAGEIAAHFSITGASISHHLSVMRDAGLVLDDRVGKYIYYELNLTVVDELLAWAADLKGDGS